MCFFINLEVSPQKRPAEVHALINRLATSHALSLRGEFPSFHVMEGYCSCHQVLADGRSIKPIGFIEKLLSTEDVKHVKLGWTWASGSNVAMRPETDEVRLPLPDFIRKNAAQELRPEVWYRLHNPNKYN